MLVNPALIWTLVSVNLDMMLPVWCGRNIKGDGKTTGDLCLLSCNVLHHVVFPVMGLLGSRYIHQFVNERRFF